MISTIFLALEPVLLVLGVFACVLVATLPLLLILKLLDPYLPAWIAAPLLALALPWLVLEAVIDGATGGRHG